MRNGTWLACRRCLNTSQQVLKWKRPGGLTGRVNAPLLFRCIPACRGPLHYCFHDGSQEADQKVSSAIRPSNHPRNRFTVGCKVTNGPVHRGGAWQLRPVAVFSIRR
jgi:hypothetical protein